MRIIFVGSKAQGAEALKYLADRGDVKVVDGDNEVRAMAKFLGIPCLTQDEMHGFIQSSSFSKLHYDAGIEDIDLLISYLYKQKVQEPLLSYPKLGCVNFHPGLLPNFGGACGYNIAILEGAKEYGCTAHFMDDQMDRGDIIERRAICVNDNETAYSLAMRTYDEMFHLLKSVYGKFDKGRVHSFPQNNTRYMKWAEVDKLRAILSDDDTEMIDRKARAFYFPPYNGAEIELKGNKYTILPREEIQWL